LRVRGVVVVVLVALFVLPAAAQAKPFGSRTLQKGASGSDVKVLQQLLTKAGFSTKADGMYGRGTVRNVKAWESDDARTVDGKVTKPDARQLKEDANTAQPLAEEPVPDDPIDDPDEAEAEANPAQTGGAGFVQTEPGTVNDDGTATAPASAPPEVKAIIAAGNKIFDKPYKYGGGHGKWKDSGYDCSGSVSYALHGAGLLKTSLDSTGFESWGSEGPGNWVTIYANAGHAYMVVAGLRYDTSGATSRDGSRWTDEMRSSSGYVVRHPPGL
jgi:cell wall-associated NlpC family hydrolase